MKKLFIVSIGLMASAISAFELTIKNLSQDPLTFKWQEAPKRVTYSSGSAFNQAHQTFAVSITNRIQQPENQSVVINPESSQTISMAQRPKTFKVEYPIKFEAPVEVQRTLNSPQSLGGPSQFNTTGQFKDSMEFEFSMPPLKRGQTDADTLELNVIPFIKLLKKLSALQVRFDSEETTLFRGPELLKLHNLIIKK